MAVSLYHYSKASPGSRRILTPTSSFLENLPKAKVRTGHVRLGAGEPQEAHGRRDRGPRRKWGETRRQRQGGGVVGAWRRPPALRAKPGPWGPCWAPLKPQGGWLQPASFTLLSLCSQCSSAPGSTTLRAGFWMKGKENFLFITYEEMHQVIPSRLSPAPPPSLPLTTALLPTELRRKGKQGAEHPLAPHGCDFQKGGQGEPWSSLGKMCLR